MPKKELHLTEEKINEAIRLYELAGVHPALKIMPLHNSRDYSAICASVKENGFLNPVTINPEGYVIDGRALLAASIEEHITKDVFFEVKDPTDVMGFVLDRNFYRQHLTPKQKNDAEKAAKAMQKEEAQKQALWAGISE